MTDKWLAPDTCGVKLREFEQMTQDMSRAGPQLEELAAQLWQALSGAGVSTGPAMEIKRIAGWARDAASDLRRRNALVHDLDRQKLAMRVSRADGNYLVLPDRYTDQIAYAEGRRVADLVRRAASGDRKALADLRRYDPRDVTPAMAKAVLEALGPEQLLKLPADLAFHARADDSLARDSQGLMSLLGRSLAVATTPGRPGYVGDAYLGQLVQAGRTSWPPGSRPPYGIVGYQSMSSLLASAGDAKFSIRFMQTVGADMVDYDRSTRKPLGDNPLPDLSGAFDADKTMNPKAAGKADFLVPLLNAAAVSGSEGAQALLNHRPMGPHIVDSPDSMRLTNLEYLLRDRRGLWGQTDHGAALGHAIQVGAIGHDKASQDLAFRAGKYLADDARKYFKVENDRIKIENKDDLDALSGLRVPMAQVLAAHITKVNDIYQSFRFGAKTGSTPMNDADMDYLLLEVTRDGNAYDTLLKSQIAHAKVAIDKSVASGSKHLDSTIVAEGWMFGHLIEARNQSVEGEEARLAADLQRMEGYISMGVGFAADKVGEGIPTGAPGAGEAYTLLVDQVQDRLTGWLAQRMVDKPDDTILAPKSNTEAVEKLFNQMITASELAHGQLSHEDLNGQPFATHGPHSKILPLESMSGDQLEALLRWVNLRTGLNALSGDMKSSLEQGQEEAAGHIKDSEGHNIQPSFRR
ncbi:hypothetical protein J4573_25580 [Actinomadura barringtoniae]|uniref:Uncharacterized protein n=1 Tax=Actinomadura barringtoniae TaxID=1427535 RepID=A0A939PJU2_9ACTN|nr:hypothetical protein [Actinomadura barringtoniae]MBO2450499.1 hypothetical protein [Actinomadura barringtoniae]